MTSHAPFAEPLSVEAPDAEREQRYREVAAHIESLLATESDWIAAMATTVCELHHAFDYFQWTGFYRIIREQQELIIGPYQGTHGCLRITLDRGVCGAAATQRETQLIGDVSKFPGHIACSPTTRSEIVVPVLSSWGSLIAVLDVDSDTLAAFNHVDRRELEKLCEWLGLQYEADALRS